MSTSILGVACYSAFFDCIFRLLGFQLLIKHDASIAAYSSGSRCGAAAEALIGNVHRHQG